MKPDTLPHADDSLSNTAVASRRASAIVDNFELKRAGRVAELDLDLRGPGVL